MLSRVRRSISPRRLLLATLVYLFLTIAVSFAVDVHDAFGLRSRMAGLEMNHPAVWYQIFGSRKITEVFQWLALVAAVPLAAATAGHLTALAERRAARFWGLVSVGLALMLLEDAGNPRDIITAYFGDLFPEYGNVIQILVLLAIFGVIGLTMVYAAYRFGDAAWTRFPASRVYLVVGYAVLFIGAASDPLGVIGLYEPVGQFLHDVVGHGQMIVFRGHTVASQGGMLVDSVYEESLELVGYVALMGAALAANRAVAEPPEERTPPDTAVIETTGSTQPASSPYRSCEPGPSRRPSPNAVQLVLHARAGRAPMSR